MRTTNHDDCRAAVSSLLARARRGRWARGRIPRLVRGPVLGTVARNVPADGRGTVRDRWWVWAVDASYDFPAAEEGTSPARNRISPVGGAVFMGVPNAMFVHYNGAPPFGQYYTPFKALKQAYWTLSNNGNQVHDLGPEQEHVYRLAADNPNITGLLLDDFPIGPLPDGDDSLWLAGNDAAFPVSLETEWPGPVVADSVVLTQADWVGGGYRTAKFAVDASADGTAWTEVATGGMPDAFGGSHRVRFPKRSARAVRVRVLSTQDPEVVASCGLKGVTAYDGDREVPLAGATVRASSEYPGRGAAKLLAFRTAAAGRPKAFSSQVSAPDLAAAKQRMRVVGGRRLDLAVVVYSNQVEPGIVPILKDVDVVLFWTWTASDLRYLESNVRRLKELLPDERVVLGCYMWDFSNGRLMSPERMRAQCELGLKWLEPGGIEGMVFLGTNIMDKHLEAVNWTQEWIARVRDRKLK